MLNLNKYIHSILGYTAMLTDERASHENSDDGSSDNICNLISGYSSTAYVTS